jgi:ribosome-associated protein
MTCIGAALFLSMMVIAQGYHSPSLLLARRAGREDLSLRSSTSSRDKMIIRAMDKMEFKRTIDTESLVPLKEEPLLPFLETVVQAADGRKAADIHAIRVSAQSEIATFMVILEGNSRPQLQAIANSIEDDVLLRFAEAPSKEGTATSGWIVLDYGSIIIHVMTPQMRNFYKIEKRWKDAEVLDMGYLVNQVRQITEEEGFSSSELGEAPMITEDLEDPFWN